MAELKSINFLTDLFTKFLSIAELLIIALVLILLFNFSLLFIKKRLLRSAKSKAQISNIKLFSRIINITVIWMILIFAFLSYFRSWTGIGVVAGLFTAAIGFALQRPITGVAAWIMVVIKRPFRVGDRISIGPIKGDVYDISLTHVYIDEVGGGLEAEQHSGRNVLVPNYKLFEENIINHTLIHDYVLDEVVYTIRPDSDLNKAMALGIREAEKLTGKYSREIKKEVSARMSIAENGIRIKVLFFAPVQQLSKLRSDLSKAIYESILLEKSVELLYGKPETVVKK